MNLNSSFASETVLQWGRVSRKRGEEKELRVSFTKERFVGELRKRGEERCTELMEDLRKRGEEKCVSG